MGGARISIVTEFVPLNTKYMNKGLGILKMLKVYSDYPLSITHYPLPITHYPLPITHYPLPI